MKTSSNKKTLLRSLARHALCSRASAVVEFAFVLPLLIIFTFGAVEFSHMYSAYFTVSHLTREAGSVLAREVGSVGSDAWVTNVNNDMTTVIDSASPVINRTGSGAKGPSQFKIVLSMVEWNASASVCSYNLDHTLGLGCTGNIANGLPDRYRIRRSNSGWSGTTNVTWQYGSLSATTKVGADGECACKYLPQVEQLTDQGLTFYVVELFYNYAPSTITSLQKFIGNVIPGTLYHRSVFLDL